MVYVHRDFMPRNLMLPEQGGLGVLDFQDAVYGPVTYDIASLMRDAFISWDEEFVIDITVRYWSVPAGPGCWIMRAGTAILRVSTGLASGWGCSGISRWRAFLRA